ncbi:universal stress protein [Ornithinimicrobium cerasi]|uniref:Universal stress protein family protein n=1 Tax=Ornithinimicrobium cerasi TaxID=2248773 RepID=A0A285VPD3_9MICO|nr:universal stress protein [Ornithinimicrobium cerasi]SOC55919.1 Universal stress protein family protein [Ornithinimicrobium cerasi]
MSATVQAPGPVLVGVDGSGRNASAVAWAAAEARASSAPLVLLHDASGAGERAGRATVDRAAAQVADVDRELRPVGEVVTRVASEALTDTAREYGQTLGHGAESLVVVGRRGAGGFTRLSLGSTARALVHGEGPATVLVPSGWDLTRLDPHAPVVVDVSHDADDHALEHAVTRCVRDGRPLVALSAWSVDLVEGLIDRPIPRVWDEHADRAERELEERLAPWRAAYPDLEVVALATDRHRVAALLDQAVGAELLVVPRGRSACAVAEYAQCPVAVV